MKTLLRIAVIVAASLVVIGAALAYVQYGGNTLLAQGPGRGEFIEGGTRPQRGQGTDFAPPGDGQAFAPPEGGAFNGAAGEGFQREGGRAAGGFGEILKNVLVMGVIALVVIVLSVAWRRLSGLWRRPTPPTAPTAPPAA